MKLTTKYCVLKNGVALATDTSFRKMVEMYENTKFNATKGDIIIMRYVTIDDDCRVVNGGNLDRTII